MGSLGSRFLSSVSATDTKTPKPVRQGRRLDDFPETEEQARSECLKILKEMEYRSIRAAKMAYERSDEYEKMHFGMAFLVSVLSATTMGASNYLVKVKLEAMPKPLKLSICGSVSMLAGLFSYRMDDTLLPHMKKKHDKLNSAGAEWQAFELELRTFRTTALQKDMSLNDIRNKTLQFVSERKTICKIGKTSQRLHNKYEKNPDKLFESKRGDLKAIKDFFEIENEATKTTDENV